MRTIIENTLKVYVVNEMSGRPRLTNDEFVKKLIKIFGNEYGLEKVDYVTSREPITLVCPIHGDFKKLASHLYKGSGCPQCSALKVGETKSQNAAKDIIDKFKKVHGDRYDYSKFEYFKSYVPSVIICPIHGEFKQSPSNHLSGRGCKQCAYNQPKYNSIDTNEFIQKAQQVHGDKYNYNQVVYKNADTPVTIVCPVHGEFEQRPSVHLYADCPKCGIMKRKSNNRIKEQNTLIKKFREVHGDKFSYDKVNYLGNNVKIIITCPKHGDFEKTPASHKQGVGCPICGDARPPYTDSIFIDRATEVHGGKYDYSQVRGVSNQNSIVNIICPLHGVFNQRVRAHISGQGCMACFREFTQGKHNKKYTEDFLNNAIKTHGDRYDYSLVDYVGAQTPVNIICRVHGEFQQLPSQHIKGANCPKCAGGVKLTSQEFIDRATLVHNNTYDYSLVDYKNWDTPVSIVCKKHGEFSQRAGNHLKGTGCPKCSESRGEKVIRAFLDDNSIVYEIQKKYNECVNISFNKNDKKYCVKLPFDFYLPTYNLLIEYDGEQHYKPISKFGGEKQFKKTQILDKIKTDFAKSQNIPLLRVPYTVKPADIPSFLKKYLKLGNG